MHASSLAQPCRLLELLKANYTISANDVEPTEASLGWDTEALPAPSMDSAMAPTVSAVGQQDFAPRHFDRAGKKSNSDMLYIHRSSLLGWHRVLGHPVRTTLAAGSAFAAGQTLRCCMRTARPVLLSDRV